MGLPNEEPRDNAPPAKPRRQGRCRVPLVHQHTATGWARPAGLQAVANDLGSQIFKACKRPDVDVLDALIASFSTAACTMRSFRNTHDNLDQDTQS